MKLLIGVFLVLALYGLFSSMYALSILSVVLAGFSVWADRTMTNRLREDRAALETESEGTDSSKPKTPA